MKVGSRPSIAHSRPDEAQDRFWDGFWARGPGAPVDRVALVRKMEKQGGPILESVSLEGKCILDVGCGLGFIDRFLAGNASCEIVGLDFKAHLARPRGQPGLRFVAGDGLRLPFGSDTFDVVMAVETLHHLPRESRYRALQEMCRVLKPGGDLVLVEVNRFHPLIFALSVFDPSERHQLTLSIRALKGYLRSRFREVVAHPVTFLLPTYKYRSPPLVERIRPLIHRLEDLTERSHLSTEYVLVGRGSSAPSAEPEPT